MSILRPRLIVSDMDGCVLPASYRTWDFTALNELAKRISGLSPDEMPVFTLCSGRSQQYMCGLVNGLGISSPVVCEAGSVIYEPKLERISNPFPPERLKIMEEVRAVAQERLIMPGIALLEEGKTVCISLHPADPGMGLERLFEIASSIMNDCFSVDFAAQFEMTHSACAVDITPAGVHKGSGLVRIMEMMGLSAGQVAVIGDAPNDKPMFDAAGYRCCPANARQSVKDLADYVSPYEECRGVLDIIDHICGL